MDRLPAKISPQGYVVIHGHFYQPPRENPWIEQIEVEPSAAPLPRLEYPHHRRVLPPQRRGPRLRRPGADPGYRQQLPASQLQFRPHPHQLAEGAGAGNLCQDPGGRCPEPGGPGARQRHRPGLQPCHPAPGQCPGPGNPGHLGPQGLRAPVPAAGRGHVAAGDRGELPHPGHPGGPRHEVRASCRPYQAKRVRPLTGGEWTPAPAGPGYHPGLPLFFARGRGGRPEAALHRRLFL